MAISRLLGRKEVRHDYRTLQIANYLPSDASLPPLPASIDWTPKIRVWPMMANDKVGDCTVASLGHMVQLWTTWALQSVIISNDDIIGAYSAVSGYNPDKPGTDNGAISLDVLNYWRKTGVAGHKIIGYVRINPKNLAHLRRAIQLFGGVYAGVAMPKTAKVQVAAGQDWVVKWPLQGDSAPGTWGGHAVPLVGFDPQYFTCVTWGGTQRMTANWWLNYGDEAYAAISYDWLDANGISPSHFNLRTLLSDLRVVAN